MVQSSLTGLDKRRLRLGLMLFFAALAIPTAVLIRQAYSQLKWETFHQYQLLATEVAARIDMGVAALISDEEARSFADYSFLVVAGGPAANFVQRSLLSAYPVAADIAGLIGYFQVDSQGAFSTPFLPPSVEDPLNYGISAAEMRERLALRDRIQRILSENRLVQGGRADVSSGDAERASDREGISLESEGDEWLGADDKDRSDRGASGSAVLAPIEKQVMAQKAFDRLNEAAFLRQGQKKQDPVSSLGRVEELKLEQRFRPEPTMPAPGQVAPAPAPKFGKRSVRKERTAVAGTGAQLTDELSEARVEVRVTTFESEIDPFEFSLLDSGHFVLFRKVWRDGERYIQGALLERGPFLRGITEAMFRGATLSRMSNLVVAFQGDVFEVFSGQATKQFRSSAAAFRGELLYQTRLSAPLHELELIFSVNRLPAGPGARVITWLAAILAVVLCGGFYLIYRLGARQIGLARQQQDFISAVSHELKTPLTSIRMYSEILREGWAPEEKIKTYYDYIHDESERLSRLINNVLQLARMTRNDLKVDLKRVLVRELMDGIRSKVANPVERAGFELNLDSGNTAETAIQIDADYFTQIIINLVDNAIKFSARTDCKRIDVACRIDRDGIVTFAVRDYGPGIPRDQMKKIFQLFYRSENELTRETMGTGIGLALVHQLALAMRGRVAVVNTEPGAELKVSFPRAGA